MKKIIQYFLFLTACILFFLPEHYLPFLEEKMNWQIPVLGGAHAVTPKPTWWSGQVLSGRYQRKYNNHVVEASPIMPLLVRSRNEFEYQLFGILGNTNEVLGKDNFIFNKSYCEAYIGIDYKGEDWIKTKAQQVKTVADFFQQKGIHFLVASPPAKAHLVPDKLPSFYQNYPRGKTNRAGFKQAFQAHQIPFIDFEYFIPLQKEMDWLIYPQAGLHWGGYGLGLAMDTLRNYFVEHFNANVGAIKWKDDVVLSVQLSDSDGELMENSNHLTSFDFQKHPYPNFKFEFLPEKERSKILVIGDSYYQILWKTQFQKQLFSDKSSFWYYFEKDRDHPKYNVQQLYNDPQLLLDEVGKYDIVLYTCAEINLAKFGFNFFETMIKGIKRKF